MNARRFWSQDEEEIIRRMYGENASLMDICLATSRLPKGVAYKIVGLELEPTIYDVRDFKKWEIGGSIIPADVRKKFDIAKGVSIEANANDPEVIKLIEEKKKKLLEEKEQKLCIQAEKKRLQDEKKLQAAELKKQQETATIVAKYRDLDYDKLISIYAIESKKLARTKETVDILKHLIHEKTNNDVN